MLILLHIGTPEDLKLMELNVTNNMSTPWNDAELKIGLLDGENGADEKPFISVEI